MIVKEHNVEGSPEDFELEARLRITMDKIEAILKEDDCAGFIVIAKPGGARVRVTMAASWSCARISQEGDFTLSTSSLPVEGRERIIAETGNALSSIADLTAQGGVELLTASEYVNDKFGLTHVCMGRMNPPVKH